MARDRRDHFKGLRRHLDNPAASHLKGFLIDVISTFEDRNNSMEDWMTQVDDQLKALSDAQAQTDAKLATLKDDVSVVMNNVTALQSQLANVPQAGLTADQATALQAAIDHANAINSGLTAIDASLQPAPAAAPAAAASGPTT